MEIRKAERKDAALLLDFIKGIARYEKLENEVVASVEVLECEMFDEHRAEAIFAVVDGREVGFALYFYNFSTFIGHSGLYLEDLFVWPEYRGKGIGTALMQSMQEIVSKQGYKGISLSVQKQNYAAKMYRKLGFKTIEDKDEELIMVYMAK